MKISRILFFTAAILILGYDLALAWSIIWNSLGSTGRIVLAGILSLAGAALLEYKVKR